MRWPPVRPHKFYVIYERIPIDDAKHPVLHDADSALRGALDPVLVLPLAHSLDCCCAT
jgi:hypothetical protein